MKSVTALLFNARIRNLLAGLITSHLFNASAAADDYFNPEALDKNAGMVSVDLSALQKPGGAIAGRYSVDIYLNEVQVDSRIINFVSVDTGLAPQLTKKALVSFGLNEDASPSFRQLPPDAIVENLANYIPLATYRYEESSNRLLISVPQTALRSNPAGAVPAELWDQGIASAFVSYDFSGSSALAQRHVQDPQYLSLRNGANWDAWRYRNYTVFTADRRGRKWNNLTNYLQRDVQALRGQLTVGDAYTSSEMFDSFGFRGVSLSSDDNMLPDSLRGFAPVVRGVARSNAQVTIRQNGSVIYQSWVPPGPFAISDLYPTAASGKLDVTVQEADGTESHFSQPFSAVPVMQRQGSLKYSLSAGKYHQYGAISSAQPYFNQATIIYGIASYTTLYGGVLRGDDYASAALGIGQGLGPLGSFSFDITGAKTHNSQVRDTGQSFRFQYAKTLEDLGTAFTLAGYRYSTSGFYDFSEANYRQSASHAMAGEVGAHGQTKKSKLQLDLNQNFYQYGALFLSAWQQSYWGVKGSETNATAGYNVTAGGNNYALNYSVVRNPFLSGNDRIISFNVQIPLGHDNANSWATLAFTQNKNGTSLAQTGVSGTALADQNLNYSLQMSHETRHGDRGAAGNVEYRSTAGILKAGYNQGQYGKQLNYGISGGAVFHGGGLTLSQPLGDTFAIVSVPGASAVKVLNNPGVYTDSKGYAVVPYLSAYHVNRINIDTATLNDNMDVSSNSARVIPTYGAVNIAKFPTKSGRKVLFILSLNQQPIPYGALARIQDNKQTQRSEGIVDERGRVYLNGVPDEGSITVFSGTRQLCQATYQAGDTSAAVQIIHANCIKVSQ